MLALMACPVIQYQYILVKERKHTKEGVPMEYTFRPGGVCSQEIHFSIENGIVTGLSITGGCAGNLAGISRLVIGMPVRQVIASLDGITCGDRKTSCPDQIAKALRARMEQEG